MSFGFIHMSKSDQTQNITDVHRGLTHFQLSDTYLQRTVWMLFLNLCVPNFSLLKGRSWKGHESACYCASDSYLSDLN